MTQVFPFIGEYVARFSDGYVRQRVHVLKQEGAYYHVRAIGSLKILGQPLALASGNKTYLAVENIRPVDLRDTETTFVG